MSADTRKLALSVVALAITTFLVARALVTKRLRTRFGLVITPKDRPFSFYATIALYSLVACAFLVQAIRSALNVLAR